jgi:PAS domain S-box-containing protein
MSTAAAAAEQTAKDCPTKVLVAQGDAISLTHVRELLARSGYDVTTTQDGLEALQLLQSAHPPGLAVLDCSMPGIDGMEICRRLRQGKQRPYTYVILLTTWSQQKQRIEGLEAGADDCLYKPVDVRELRVRLQIGTRIILERELQAAHAETELFLRFVPSILIGLDCDGRITRWNATATNVFGLPESAVLGRPIDDCGIHWLHPEMGLEVSRWLQVDSIYRCDSLAYQHQDKVRVLGLHVRRISLNHDKNAGFILTGADITERKCLEEQLRQAQKLEAIGQLAAGIAHEINTPTQYVGDNTRFLKDSWGSVAQLLELCQTMRREAAAGAPAAALFTKFDQMYEQLDFEYLLQEIPHAIDQSLEGLQRVAKIVGGMKEFSHPGSEEKRAIDLNRAIETTITVARHE